MFLRVFKVSIVSGQRDALTSLPETVAVNGAAVKPSLVTDTSTPTTGCEEEDWFAPVVAFAACLTVEVASEVFVEATAADSWAVDN